MPESSRNYVWIYGIFDNKLGIENDTINISRFYTNYNAAFGSCGIIINGIRGST